MNSQNSQFVNLRFMDPAEFNVKTHSKEIQHKYAHTHAHTHIWEY